MLSSVCTGCPGQEQRGTLFSRGCLTVRAQNISTETPKTLGAAGNRSFGLCLTLLQLLDELLGAARSLPAFCLTSLPHHK